MTKFENFTAIANILNNIETENKTVLQEFVKHELELLENRKNRKPSENELAKKKAKADANKAFIKTVFDYLTENPEGDTLGNILKALETEDYSVQKLTMVIKPYKDNGVFTTTKKSGKTIYTANEWSENE